MSKIKVLITDDYQIIADDLAEIISQDDSFTVVGKAFSGKEAVEMTKKVNPDLVLMDIEMESANAGVIAAEQILAYNPKILIVYLTSHETEKTVITAMATGAVDYIVKGLTKEQLLEHLHQVVNGDAQLDTKIQKVLMSEYQRLRKSENSLLFFIKKLSDLTPAEKELVRFLLQGYKIKEIAEIRYVEIGTIKTQIHSLLRKFDCKRTSEVVKTIEELGISELF